MDGMPTEGMPSPGFVGGEGFRGGEVPGETETMVDGVKYSRGDHVHLRLEDRPDPYDRMMDGKTATIERIYFDYEDKLYFGVTLDDDPGQDLMRETGRFLFFFTGEVEVIES